MCIKNIEYCSHCVSYSPEVCKKIDSNGTVKLYISCANQKRCIFGEKQKGVAKHREQLIHEIALDLNSKGYDMRNRHDTLTGYYELILVKDDMKVTRVIDEWACEVIKYNDYIKTVIKEMISELNAAILKKWARQNTDK